MMKLLSMLFGAKSTLDREDAPTDDPEIMEVYHGGSSDPLEDNYDWMIEYYCNYGCGWTDGCQHGYQPED